MSGFWQKKKFLQEEAQTKREIEQILQETKEVQAELLSWENEKRARARPTRGSDQK